MQRSQRQKIHSIITFCTLIVLFIGFTLFLPFLSSQEGVIVVSGGVIPIQSLTGVVSFLANSFLILLVVFHKKPGFIAASILLLIQIPRIIVEMVSRHSFANLTGIFSTIFTLIVIFAIFRRSQKIDEYQHSEVAHLKEQSQAMHRLFEQTATALVNAVDAKDTYSHGHSLRVASYSEMIAREAGKSEEECKKIYYSALLHDVGKIGIPNTIINKKGRLTEEEYDIIKEHPQKGNSILSSISEYPYLSIGAHYHHERYDGKGYPNRLKGEDIPEIARIISVADAYDAMSSNRSYREAIPQQLIREEIIKGAGTQFDPKFAAIMRKLIDKDPGYRMREKVVAGEITGKDSYKFTEYRQTVSDGIPITSVPTNIHLRVKSDDKASFLSRGASIILFDSLDERVHDDETTIIDLCYFEYAELFFDGKFEKSGARKIKVDVDKKSLFPQKFYDGKVYDIVACKYKDHVQIKLSSEDRDVTFVVALPDSSRYAYIGITGEECEVSELRVNRLSEPIGKDHIKRIAEEISYIERPEGNIPNVQIDGHLTEWSRGIELVRNLEFDFFSMSLPTARLVWHCPYFVVFSSDDGQYKGPNYKEFAMVRLDGEFVDNSGLANNTMVTDKDEEFGGWDDWKEFNKRGFDCKVTFERTDNTIVLKTRNFGLSIENTTKISGNEGKVYVAITGDQVAITGINVLR